MCIHTGSRRYNNAAVPTLQRFFIEPREREKEALQRCRGGSASTIAQIEERNLKALADPPSYRTQEDG